MLYYGDRARELAPGVALAEVREALAAAAREEGLARHARLVEALVAAGELAQALADVAARARGHDDDDPAAAAAMALAGAAARAAWASWCAGFRGAAVPPPAEVERLSADVARRCDPARALRATVPEGYAHYALYPETYGEAAAAGFGGADRPPVVVGIRSIGTGLAALVAAATGASAVATVRPVGHPWDRALALGGALAARLEAAARDGASFAVVDEGPGLSGSSFAAVVRWLERAGAAPGAIHLFPAHGAPPGHAASAEVRARWERSARHLAPFESAVAPRLAAWASEVAGPLGALEDVSAGGWRRGARGGATRWPPVFAQAEKRKYLARPAAGGALLLRFAGLGRHGAAALRRARALADAGFAPPALGLAHGFLVERWMEGAPLDVAGAPREALVRHLARYLAFRARAFPAGGGEGASPTRLLELVAVNAREALGPEAEAAARALEPGARVAAPLARCEVDAKLEAWEWLVAGGGALVKTDALDHAHGHDLVGPQPVAWDVAGAAVEHALGAAGRDDLAARVAREAGCEVPAAALPLFEAAYLAQRVGRWSFALACEADAAERARIEALLARYRDAFARALGVS